MEAQELKEFLNDKGPTWRFLGSRIDEIPNKFTQIFGELKTWKQKDSELRFILEHFKSFRFLRLFGYALDASFDSRLLSLLGFSFKKATKLHPSEREENGKHADEKWFFINGVLTNREVGELNRKKLEDVFERRIGFIHNPTESLTQDFTESLEGLASETLTEPAKAATEIIGQALGDPDVKRVIVLPHSQGCIIMSNVLKRLFQDPEQRENMDKLEIYTFACPAQEMQTESEHDGTRIGRLEHFTNEHDFFSHFGILSNDRDEAKLPGPVYEKAGMEGHLLNAHYLHDFQERPYKPKNGNEDAHLYTYLSNPSAH